MAGLSQKASPLLFFFFLFVGAPLSGALSEFLLRAPRGARALAAAPREQAASCVGTGCRILGVGAAVPETRITNDDLAKIVDTNDEIGIGGKKREFACGFCGSAQWIRTRTGIAARRVLRHGEALRDLSVAAAQKALAASGLAANKLDLLLHASSSPDDLFGDGPWLAAQLQRPGDAPAPAFDLTAACSGFVVGLITANMYLSSPGSPYRTALLVGSDALSRWLDWRDRNTCILFGDGAGAAVLSAAAAAPAAAAPAAAAAEGQQQKPLGLLSYVLHSDGFEQKQIQLHYRGAEAPLPLRGPGGGCVSVSSGAFAPLSMNGREVFKFVSRKVPISLEAAFAAAGVAAAEVDWLLMHQANKRILDAVADRLNIPKHKVLCNLEEYGNTSAASVPLCLAEAVQEGKVKKGDVIAIAGFGAGLTWAAAVLRYG
ncbi:3-oxoacyl-(acyl-carrier-protein) synthase III family protein, putative [Eimeria tenella]|uniref:3-oxoacyl-(Acyl-carrier-protein) synthase III family protein, putative n=1 Tax=Eimeria tenella TaxID=5802 RepID=U6KL37_EIMTE|nr:3-oxoacyl-(acyl-carrier-protein) synthase III family protein, putative [Eimeria tenella]CDJ37526.1 3-oxoacyl-(acyl-carrier-protein) synthase III family protein, putative [Eimeria tenella]|eukprot:XP_013228364.1 3-oxoacyl-(acyl-carrier-protein) synthase III family protein, putative [Eimeria tenella]